MIGTPGTVRDDHSRPALIAFRGLPASGKTTAALQLLADSPHGTVARCNRDALRRMVQGRPRYDTDSEAVITMIATDTITTLLRTGHTVLVDDTNLADEHVANLRLIAGVCGAEFQIHDLRHVPLQTCLDRDRQRPEDEQVGERVIRGMHARYLARPST
jgi:predicted kinase